MGVTKYWKILIINAMGVKIDDTEKINVVRNWADN